MSSLRKLRTYHSGVSVQRWVTHDSPQRSLPGVNPRGHLAGHRDRNQLWRALWPTMARGPAAVQGLVRRVRRSSSAGRSTTRS